MSQDSGRIGHDTQMYHYYLDLKLKWKQSNR